MQLTKTVKRSVQRLLHGVIVPMSPRGTDLFHDIAGWLPATPIATIFDVGANVGQSARAYRKAYPAAAIHSFEPVPATFARLQAAVRGLSVATHPIALGAAAARAQVAERNSSTRNTIELSGEDGLGVVVQTIDTFCRDQQIDRLSLLKIDTEGHDLEVLRGASEMLGGQQVDLVEVEAGMTRRNDYHQPLEALKEYLEDHGYLLFGIYDQVGEWTVREPYLRRANLVFISPTVAEANRRRGKSER